MRFPASVVFLQDNIASLLFAPSISFSQRETHTNNSTIKFNFDLRSANTDVCNASYALGHDAGFSGWIGQVVASLNATVAGAPTVSMQSYEYDNDFVVTTKAGLKGEFDILPVKGSASYDASRSDIQHLTITINAVHVVGGAVVRGGVPFSAVSNSTDKISSPPTLPPKTQGESNPVCIEQVGGNTKPGGAPLFRRQAR